MRHRPWPLILIGAGRNKETLLVIGTDYSTLEIVRNKNMCVVKGHSDGRFVWIMLRKHRMPKGIYRHKKQASARNHEKDFGPR